MYKSSNLIKKLEKPVLTYKDIPYKAALIFNAGVAKINGKYIMLFRNDYGDYEKQELEGTNLGLAYSDDGINWKAEPQPNRNSEFCPLFLPVCTERRLLCCRNA